ncbi:unnamed protein product [Paramecium sonneborni]|uniref:Transmembrane protein n=1 Tax=Paramecium sonneborni TaxID=65129 RepID=A0A8S1QUN1_9CILI|nr:unnamed protein product [Paramecium sonneborni]
MKNMNQLSQHQNLLIHNIPYQIKSNTFNYQNITQQHIQNSRITNYSRLGITNQIIKEFYDLFLLISNDTKQKSNQPVLQIQSPKQKKLLQIQSTVLLQEINEKSQFVKIPQTYNQLSKFEINNQKRQSIERYISKIYFKSLIQFVMTNIQLMNITLLNWRLLKSKNIHTFTSSSYNMKNQILQQCELQYSNLLKSSWMAYQLIVDWLISERFKKGQKVVIQLIFDEYFINYLIRFSIKFLFNFKKQGFQDPTAAGATGLFYIQLALNMHCDFIGDKEKIIFLQKQFPGLQIINYKVDDQDKQIENYSLDYYFDNKKQRRIERLRYVVNGKCSNYNERQGLNNMNRIIYKRLKLKGITFNQEQNKIQAAFDYLFQQFQQKKLKIFQEEYNQLIATPQALKNLFKGENIGKKKFQFRQLIQMRIIIFMILSFIQQCLVYRRKYKFNQFFF